MPNLQGNNVLKEMEKEINILHLEDEDIDAELVCKMLESGSVNCKITLVKTRDEFDCALHQGGFDIILSDYNLPGYDGVSALKLALELTPDIPFIFVSGTMGEDAAIEGLTAGATDYVLKQKLSRLVPAVKRALQEAQSKLERKQAMDALRVSEERYRTLVEQASDGIFIADSNGNYLDVNQSGCNLLGYSHEEILRMNMRDLVAAFDQIDNPFRLDEMRSGKNVLSERNMVRNDGSLIPVEISGTMLPDGRFLGFVRDITERKRMEEKLHDQELRFREIFNNASDGIFLIEVAEDGRFRTIEANLTLAEATGIPLIQTIGKFLDECKPEAAYQITISQLKRCLAAGTITQEDAELELPTGHCYFNSSYIPLRNVSGRIHRIAIISRDITEQKKAEEKIIESEERYKRITAGITDYLYAVKIKDGKVVETIHNDACYFITGYTPKEFADDPFLWINMFLPEERELVADKFSKIIEGENISPIEHRIVCKNGKVRWISNIVIPKYDSNGVLVSYDGVIKDITERKKAEETLHESEQRYRTLVENTQDLIVRYDTNLRRIYVNPAWEKASGLSSEEVINVSSSDIPRVPNPVNHKYLQKLQNAINTGMSQSIDFMWTNAYGENLFLEYTISPEYDRYGKVVSLLSVGHDITERKRAEKEHLANLCYFENMDVINRDILETNNLEQMMSNVLESVLSIFDCDRAFLLYPCDPQTQFWQVPMECNKPEYPGVRALGLTMPTDANVAETFRNLLASDGPIQFGPHSDYPLPDEVSERFNFKSILSMAIYPKVGKPWQFGLHQCSYSRVWTKEEERLLQEIGRRLADSITSQLTFQELQESEWKHREIFENVLDSLYLLEVTDDGRFRNIEINPAFESLTGLSRSQLIGKTIEETVPDEVARIANAKYRRCVEAGYPIEEEVELNLPSGKRYLHSTLIPARDEKGRIHHIVGISRDITDQKHAEAQIIKLNRIYSVLSNINQAVVRISDVNLLINEVCRIAIECGKFRMVWIGLINQQTNEVEVSASSGFTEDYLNKINIDLNDEIRSNGPVGRLIKSGHYFISNDIDNDDVMLPWREDARRVGYKSVASFPIKVLGKVRGSINLYSSEVDYFNNDEIQLLDEMAMDVSFAFEYIEHEIERKRVEEKLKESEEKFRSIFENHSAIKLLIDPESGSIIDANKAAALYYGWTREELKKMKISQINILSSEDIENRMKEVKDKKRTYFEFQHRQKDGSLRDVEVYSSQIDFFGKSYLHSIIHDISKRKLAEDALKDSEEKYRKLAQTASDSIITINKDGLIISWNEAAEKTFGYSSYEVIGKEMQLILPPKLRQTHTIALDELKAGRDPRILGKTITVEAIRKNGNKLPIELSLSSWETKTSVFYTAIIRDISERSKAELELEIYRNHLEELVKLRTLELDKANESLRKKIEKDQEIELMLQQSLDKEKELNEMKSRFISTISHEFRTPLTSVFSSTELLQNYGSRWTLEKKEEFYERIKKSVKYLTRLLDDVLTISRTETGKINFNPEQIDLKMFAKECIEDAKSLMNEKHQLKFEYKTSLKQFYLDVKLLRFILSNLLSNALKYSPNGGIVSLTISVIEKHLLIEVSDQGIGIPPEEKYMIFQAFYRTSNIETIAGTGLGLTIVERAVGLHDGQICVKSELNKGTTFSIKIPKVKS